MTERGADFDAKREAYEAARVERNRLIDSANALTLEEFQAGVKAAQKAVDRAHKAMLEAWG